MHGPFFPYIDVYVYTMNSHLWQKGLLRGHFTEERKEQWRNWLPELVRASYPIDTKTLFMRSRMIFWPGMFRRTAIARMAGSERRILEDITNEIQEATGDKKVILKEDMEDILERIERMVFTYQTTGKPLIINLVLEHARRVYRFLDPYDEDFIRYTLQSESEFGLNLFTGILADYGKEVFVY